MWYAIWDMQYKVYEKECEKAVTETETCGLAFCDASSTGKRLYVLVYFSF